MIRNAGLVPNHGGGPQRRRTPLRRAAYVLEGPLRFVDRDGRRASLRVETGNACGRRLAGRTVTLDLAGARVGAADRNGDGVVSLDDLVTGERVTVTMRMPRSVAKLPAVFPVRRVAVHDAGAAPEPA